MNRPAGQTTEVTRALWFRISPRRMFFVCRQVFECFTLVGVCMCMSAWINERMTEWLFFFRLKTKNLIKTKSQTNRHWAGSNSQTLDHWIPHSASETTEDARFETGLAGYIYLTWIGQRGQTTEVTRALWFRISPRRMFFVCRQVFQCFTLVGVCMCMSAWINERMTEWLFFFRLKTNILIKKNWGMELIRTGKSQISNPTC